MSVNDHRTEPTTELLNVQLGATENSATFIFGNEDHTLGNALRHILIQRNDTDFCGYSVPHPYEPKMHLRLQTTNGLRAMEGLRRGLTDLEESANLLDSHFSAALDRFRRGGSTEAAVSTKAKAPSRKR